MSEKLCILIDDTRDIYGSDIICRTSKGAKQVLKLFQDKIEYLMLDFDLGYNSKENGLDVAKWAIENKCLPNNIQIVSSIPKLLIEFLEKNGYVYNKEKCMYQKKD